jgi:predicted RNA-binding Zn ribbon-like protein
MATYSGIAQIPLVAGHPALNLVNTVEPRLPPKPSGGPVEPVLDHFSEPADLLVWARRSELLNAAEILAEEDVWSSLPELAKRSLDGVVAVREALYDVLRWLLDGTTQGGSIGLALEPQLELLSAGRAAAAARTQLRVSPDGVSPDGRPAFSELIGTEPGLVILDRVAVAAIELLTAVDLGLLRACPLEAGGCGWLFLDRSRGHTRRWCVMADCGTKAKSRRLNDRRRAARASR